MKKEKVQQKLEKLYSERLYVRLTRSKGEFEGISTGFIVGKSDDFILLQETNDFRVLGYLIIPINTITHVRYDENDKTVKRILEGEGQLKKVKDKYKIDLTNWESIAKDVQKTKLTVISECEDPKQDYFCIGKIKKVNKKSIAIRYFDAQGILDEENTKHKFKDITILRFDDRYANVFSKYVRKQR